MEARSFTFTKDQHLRKPAEFDHVYSQKLRAGDQHLLIFAAPNQMDWSRIGLSVSKKNGNAIKRNRIKRLLREAFRLQQHQLPSGWDWILIPRVNSGAGVHDYQKSLRQITSRLVRKFERASGEASANREN